MTDRAAPFDRALQRRREARAAGASHFLLDRVAAEIADRAGAITLDFAAGLDLSPRAGVLAAALADRAGSWTLAPAVAPSGGGRRHPAVVTDEEWLPFAGGSFDLVVSGLGLHRVGDLPGALVQINRTLRPDGLLLASLFAGDTLAELRTAFAEAEAETTGGASPRVMPFADVAELGRLLSRAGFALPVADLDRVTVRYATPFGLIEDLRAMGETNTLVRRSRAPLRRDTVARMAEIYATRFADPDGRIRATFDIVTLTGWHPHESQQQPLRPGSARARLADALGAAEIGAGEKAGPKPED
jgi:SAM-dependent methyltransferase